MRKIHIITEYVPLFAGMLMLLSSCEHKDLCFDHDPHAPKSEVRIEAEYEKEWQYTYEGSTDWKNYPTWQESFGMEYDALRPGIPDGLRMQVYNADGSDEIVNIAPEGEVVYMRPGEHSLLFYNNDTEYIVFDEMQSFASAKATTRTRTRSSYLGNSYMDTKNENTVNQPDMLYGSYMESYVAERSTETDVIPVTMHPLVFTYLVRYEFSHGLEYVSLARGALAGMAQAVWLNSGRTSDEAATVLYDCTVEDFGTQALVRSFGIPDFPNEHYGTRAGRKYGLNLEVRLKNGKIKSFDFDVTDQVAAQPQGGVIVVKGIEPCVKNWKKPITLARHAYGDVYKNTEMIIPGPGKVELVYTAADGTEERALVHDARAADVHRARADRQAHDALTGLAVQLGSPGDELTDGAGDALARDLPLRGQL